jgi:hypothetical protein
MNQNSYSDLMSQAQQPTQPIQSNQQNVQFNINEIDEGGFTPIGGSGGGNVPNLQTQQQQPALQKINNINEVMSAIQQAGETGATRLQSRDIPMDTYPITQDPNIQADYIPRLQQQNKKSRRYIEEEQYDTEDDIMADQSYSRNKKVRFSTIEDSYNEFQTPILLAILFFLFQLPFFKRMMHTYLSFMFHKDGNLNLQGFLFQSGLFGGFFYIIQKCMNFLV